MAPRKPEFSPATSQSATEMDNFGRARMELDFDQPFLLGPLFGDYDRHLVMIEQRLGVNISARGNRVMIDGEPDAAARAREVLLGLYDRLDKGQDVDAAAVESVIGMANQPSLDGIIAADVANAPKVMIRTRKKTIVPRSAVQTEYMEALGRDDMIFALGPAGTGKTYLAVAQAVQMLISGQVDRLILSRPAVEAVAHRAGRAAHRVGRDRDRPDRLHARSYIERRIHHPRRGAEHHRAADEDVPHPLRHA
jgi:phosphate starvation-inducible PhoH-like protein